MADHRRAAGRLVVVALIVGAACSSGDDRHHTSGARTLDRVCVLPTDCPTSGTVTRVEGITADTIAYRIVGQGRLTVPLSVGDAYTGPEISSREIAVLVTGHGPFSLLHLDAADPSVHGTNAWATEDYEWISAPSSRPSAKLLQIEGSDPSTDLTIADVRVTAEDDIHCAVVAPGRRAHHSLLMSSISTASTLMRHLVWPIGSGTKSTPSASVLP